MNDNNIDGFGADSVGWTSAKTIRLATEDSPFKLESGGSIGPLDVEYETYGELSPKKDNVVLVLHALSGDAHVAGYDKNAEETGRQWRLNKPGWWDSVIGPGKPLDTTRWHIICSNVLGGCYGTTGPSSVNPKTGKPYGLDFPIVTVSDWVRLQALLLDSMGIEKVRAVVGGSLGGQQAIEWALAYPDRVERSIVLAASPRLSTQGLAYNAVGRHCILTDSNFNNGNYSASNPPAAGLTAARMLAHITYLSDEIMHEKFGRARKETESGSFGFGAQFEVEGYLEHQGRSFVERFDANTYLYITRAMDYYDASKWGDGDLVAACERIKSGMIIVAFDSDTLYPPHECRKLAEAMTLKGKQVTYINIPSRYGHDAFLVETEPVGKLLKRFIGNASDLWEGNDYIENESRAAADRARWQDALIESIITERASVLDLGCGNGELLARLIRNKNIFGQGVEIDSKAVFSCVARGAPVFHTDLDEGLHMFEDDSYEFVILEETLQTVRRPVELLSEMLRIGKYGIVSFPNFANYKVIHDLMTKGRMPVGPGLPYQWFDTPNIHLFTLGDFMEWADENNVIVEKGFILLDGCVREMTYKDNSIAEEALLVVRRTPKEIMPEYCI